MAAGRRFGATRRTTTALLAGTIGVLAPLGVALPVWAQTAPADGYYATPPPVDDSKRPVDEKKPDKAYTQTKGCVQRAVLGQNIQINNRPWGQEYLQLAKAQEIVRAATSDHSAGGGVKVGVIDTGVTGHPWFQNRLESGGDYVAATTHGQPPGLEDCDGHGTEVAGIIAGRPDNPEVGFVGVAPDATIVSFRQLSENYGPPKETPTPPAGTTSSSPSSSENPPAGSESQLPPSTGAGGGGEGEGTSPGQTNGGRQLEKDGTAGTLKTLAEILVRIADRGDIKVVNMSVDNCRVADGTITQGEQQVQAAVHYAASKDVVIVAAAGNVGDKCLQNDQPDARKPKTIVTPPWFADDVLSVGAIDEFGSVAPFSVHGPWVGVAAPGTKIISLDPAEGSTGLANLTFESGDKASEIQGTSFAAPYVAGLAALVRAKYPDLKAKQVVDRIKETAQHPAAQGGRDNFVGAGVIDPVAALTQSLPSEVGVVASDPGPQMAQLPPANDRSSTPMIVALAGTGGGLVALLITLFVMRTIRRNRPEPTGPVR
ncbi:type VII secretion-associated serine protease mycosin [Amycolatopsis sp. WQ 127309]|uniref:type VII secretion-associated serine protease mycosin n=1 Tax=Amycolatopsis sp. WQ 127309 TaxID=2932773 RepID=UPI001FF3AD31|nr:type VII secretion-associated serine protease mycosin [Amycolatopsis sp. WQ 127309]UOZ09684.1 type VII secretion-associated serine protease mycosin [Amycolatopsis sp. WQ 127309]